MKELSHERDHKGTHERAYVKAYGALKLASAIRKIILPVASGIVVPLMSANVFALPQGGQIQVGQADITQSSNHTIINQQSNRAVIQWNSFNVNANERVTFRQPSASSAILNRIVDQNPTKILGNLTSNGQIFLINPNGIVFGKTARVNVAGIVASSLDISTKDFMTGQYTFTKKVKNKSARIINKGLINASSSGVILIGSNVMNEGKIYARLGNVALISANKVSVDFDGDGLIQFEIDKNLIEKDTLVKRNVMNTGEIISEGGHVILNAQTSKDIFTQVVNNEGVIKASRIKKRGGEVFLLGGGQSDIVNTGVIDVSGIDIADVDIEQMAGNIILQGGHITSSGDLIADGNNSNGGKILLKARKKVSVSGIISATGLGNTVSGKTIKGGNINITGQQVLLKNKTLIDASGSNGGGEILVGGDFQGKGKLKNSTNTLILDKVQLKADALATGDGGKVIVWSEKNTVFKGKISAKGGDKSGNGGFVEVSGKKNLKFEGMVDASAKQGSTGQLLLDQEFIRIIEDVDNLNIFEVPDNWSDDSNSLFEVQSDFISITKAKLESIQADVLLQATVGIEFEEFILNMKNSLTLETRNHFSDSGGPELNGKIHGVDASKVTFNLQNGKLSIKSGLNADGLNDVTTTIKLGKIFAKNGLSVSSANKIILTSELQSEADIVLSSVTDSWISSIGNGFFTLLQASGLNKSVTLNSISGDVIFNGMVNGKNNQTLNINAQTGKVILDAIKNIKTLSVNSKQLFINKDIKTQGTIDLSAVKNTVIKNSLSIDSSNHAVLLGQNLEDSNVDSHILSIDGRAISLNDVGQNKSFKQLNLSANSVEIAGNITVRDELNFSAVKTVNINGTRELRSIQESIDFTHTNLTGEWLILNARKNISLGRVNLKSLSFNAQNAQLHNDIKTSSSLDLSNAANIILKNSLSLNSQSGDLLLASKVRGNASLTLNSQGGQIELHNINTDSLYVINSGISNLHGDISTQGDIDFSQASQLNLSSDVSLSSVSGNIDLSTGVNGLAYSLSLTSANDIKLGRSQIKSFSVDTEQLILKDNLSTRGIIDLSGATMTRIESNLSIDSNNHAILLGKNLEDSSVNSHILSIDGQTISLNDIGQNKSFKQLNLSANSVEIAGNITVRDDLNFNSVNTANINGTRELRSIQESINFTHTNLTGEQLTLNAHKNVSLGRVNLQSLTVYAQNAQLYNDIETTSSLDLSNAADIILANSLSLKSQSGSLLLDSDIEGQSHSLTLDADTIELENTNVKSFSVIRDGSLVQLEGDIRSQSSIDFSNNSSLILLKDTNLSSSGDQTLSKNIDGNYSLNLISGDLNNTGYIKLSDTNLNSLSIKNSGVTELNGQINVVNNVDLSNTALINLVSNSSINSASGDVIIGSDIQGAAYQVELNSLNTITLANVDVGFISIKSNELLLTNDHVRVEKSIDFSQVNKTKISNDFSFKAPGGFIKIGDISLLNNQVDLEVEANNVELKQVSDLTNIVSSIRVKADNLVLNNNITSMNLIDFSNTDIYLKNSLNLKVIKGGNLNLEKSVITGRHSFLGLSSNQGMITLGKVEAIHSLAISNMGSTNLTASVKTLYDQDYRDTNRLDGMFIDLNSQYGNIYINNIRSGSVKVNAGKKIALYGDVNSKNINIEAKLDILISRLTGDNIEIRSTNGSIIVQPEFRVNVKANRVIFSALNSIGSKISPVNVDVNSLIVESAQTAVVNGIFNSQSININTRFVLPELEFLAHSKDYSLNVKDFSVIDSGLFMEGINLFSVSDDAVFLNEENEDLYSSYEEVSDDLSMNL